MSRVVCGRYFQGESIKPQIYALLPTSAVASVSYGGRLEIAASESEFEIAEFRSKTLCRYGLEKCLRCGSC